MADFLNDIAVHGKTSSDIVENLHGLVQHNLRTGRRGRMRGSEKSSVKTLLLSVLNSYKRVSRAVNEATMPKPQSVSTIMSQLGRTRGTKRKNSEVQMPGFEHDPAFQVDAHADKADNIELVAAKVGLLKRESAQDRQKRLQKAEKKTSQQLAGLSRRSSGWNAFQQTHMSRSDRLSTTEWGAAVSSLAQQWKALPCEEQFKHVTEAEVQDSERRRMMAIPLPVRDHLDVPTSLSRGSLNKIVFTRLQNNASNRHRLNFLFYFISIPLLCFVALPALHRDSRTSSTSMSHLITSPTHLFKPNRFE